MSKMELTLERPQTPPPSYLLTPPPTGGFSKRVRFADHDDTTTHTRSTKFTEEGESLTAFFEDPQEGSDIELSANSDGEINSSPNGSSLHDQSSSSSTTSMSSVLEKRSPFASLALAIDAPAHIESTNTEPFPFMDLPLSVRNKIYTHLLVVPALICVRQNHTSFHDEKKAFLYAERRELLPGIAYALAQLTVDGYKTRFSRFASTNINILLANKEVHAEARAALYGANAFEIVKPTNELSPPPNFSVRLFPPGCQRLVTKLNIRIHSFYDLHWLLGGGYNVIKNYYRGLRKLNLVLEMDSPSKGFGRKWARIENEQWTAYIQRLHAEMSQDLFNTPKYKAAKKVPTWIDLRVLFSGEHYCTRSDASANLDRGADCNVVEHSKREELKAALVEAWELFKRGS